ncbi:hypothetical protein GONAM_24_00800 [Gordonia namibiensis NBRC 108229]|uniref:ER-bound oxygenase mpaB/mpaB'/Rubber oxygenase catalytic domain-containing protein n=1 Tax=Gordonia namibiensis NBRC 108229 TaxID=1208314 RepID=K6VYL2_9ACTN|nr:oxygenase MpaB family protein [Gordonia namibiensis]GAC01324.1 hypothetical protein GONAM_24_00800 [Gordonia namibiensis NBRC 108229]
MDAAAVTGARNWEAVRTRHPELVDRLEVGLTQGDPLADAVVVEARERGMSFSTLVDLLESHADSETVDDPDRIEMPASMRRLLQVTSTPPTWFDAAFAASGARAWWRFGTLQSSTLYQSLIYGYKAQGFVRPLVATGRLGLGTRDRVQSTARWVAEATTPGAMLPGNPGWIATLRIRLLHAYIRDALTHPRDADGEDQGWDEAAWGVPINQTYSVMTISCGFLALPLLVARDLGIHYSSAEREAITHLWRWIGWVIGVDDDLLPANHGEAADLFRVAAEFELEPDDSSKVLIKALLHEGYDLPGVVHGAAPIPVPSVLVSALDAVTGPILRSSFAAISTRWVERPVARRMGLRRSPLHHLVDVARPAIRLREIVRTTGLLGSESAVIERELRTVRRGLGMEVHAGQTSLTR